MMNAKVLILVTAVFFAVSVLVSDREARAEDRAERAEERAEKAMERAEERAEKRAERAERAKEKAEERAEKKSRKKAEKRAKERAESTEGRAGGSDESEGRGSEDVTIKVQGGRQTEFSGTCAVGGEESAIGGQTPQSFDYGLDGQKLKCEIQNQSTGPLRVVLVGGENDRSVYQINGRGSTIKLTYTKNGISSSISSGSGRQASSSSQVSVSSTRSPGS